MQLFLRAAVPVALVALVAVPLGWRLTSLPPPSPIVEAFNDAGTTPRPVTLRYGGRTAGADVFRLRLAASTAIPLAAADEIHLLMANHSTAAVLLEAWVSLDGTACRFRTAPGAPLVNNAMLAFRRQASCDAHATSWSGELDLEVRLDMDTGRVALWTLTPPATGRVQFAEGGETLAVVGQSVTWPRPTLTRVELLAYVWHVTAPVLWARLRTAAVLALAGLGLLLWTPTSVRRAGQVAAAAFGTALVMSALALCHALLFPPLQAPDEPIHAFSLAEMTNDRALWQQVITLGNRTHFERLRHRGDQRFREIDIGQPWKAPWSIEMEFPFPIRQRSPATAWWWNVIGRRDTTSAVDHLWTLRRANAVLFGVFSGIAVAILALALPAARPAALSLAVLAVPTLPFFGSYFSDAAVSVSLGLVLAAGVAALVIGTTRAPWLGVPLALGLALAWLTGRSMWPLVVAVGSVLVGHALTGAWPARSSFWRLFAFWLPVTVAAAGGVLIAQIGGLFEYLNTFLVRHLPSAIPRIHRALESAPWIAVAGGVTLALVQWLASRFTWQSTAARSFSRVVAIALSAWILVGCLVSWFVAFPQSASIVRADDALTHAWNLLGAMAVPLRLRNHDVLLSTFFWSGMGWVDIVAPWWVLDVAIGATVAVLLWSLLEARANPPRMLRYVALFAGLALSLTVYAVGAYGLRYALYGRYLVGWYLLIVVTAWTAPALSRRSWWPWLVGALAVHAYYLQSIPVRYF
jgi:hypothetical protein